jgi:hypothetical protein
MSISTHLWLAITEPVRRDSDRLFHQQCWLWGCDIRRTEGNALLAYGFSRQRPPEGEKGSSTYLLQLDPQTLVVLWGFGMFYGSATDGGIYLGRYGFTPKAVPQLDTSVAPWLPDQLAIADPPHTYALQQQLDSQFIAALRWIAGYETWVVATYGLAYRQQCVTAWKKGLQIPAEQLIDAWNQLAARCAEAQECR